MKHTFHFNRRMLQSLESGKGIMCFPEHQGPHLGKGKWYGGDVSLTDKDMRKVMRMRKSGKMKKMRMPSCVMDDDFIKSLRNVWLTERTEQGGSMGDKAQEAMDRAIAKDRENETDKECADKMRREAMEDADRRKKVTLPVRKIHKDPKTKLLKSRTIKKKKGEMMEGGLIEMPSSSKVEELTGEAPTIPPVSRMFGKRKLTKVHRLSGADTSSSVIGTM